MKVLFIGPLPPPMTGNALPVKVLYDTFKNDIDIDIINLSKKNHRSGLDSISRVFQILKNTFVVSRKHKKNDVVYLTIAESFAGNLRDMLIYLVCRKRLSTLVVHMLGGAGMNQILSNTSSIQYSVNRYFLRRLGGIVVEGKPQFDMFSKVADPSKIHIIPNFAEDFLFNHEDEVKKKFESVSPLKILFLSNMLPGKGHFELLDAFLSLKESQQGNFQLTLAGKTVSQNDKSVLMEKIKNQKNIRYLGPVYGEEKKKAFSEAHVFCLPTYYPYEGQPFSIIEAYATGCAVITTNHSGIKYIFKDKVNGYQVEKRSVSALRDLLEKIVQDKSLGEIAINNLRQSRNLYTSQKYTIAMRSVFDRVYETNRSEQLKNRI